MKTSDILQSLESKADVIDVAWQFDLMEGLGSRATRSQITNVISRSLGQCQDEDGNRNGWEGAVRTLIEDGLCGKHLNQVLDGFEWEGARGFYSIVPSRLKNNDQKVELLLEVCLREEAAKTSGEIEEFESFICDSKWSYVFKVEEFDEQDDDETDDEQDALEDEAEDDLEEELYEEISPVEWHSQTTFHAGPNVQLPLGIERAASNLFPHQERGVAALEQWWIGEERSGVLCLPTGAGKTRTAVTFALRSVIKSGGRVLWLAHRRELVNQAIGAFLACGVEAESEFKIGRFEAGDRKHGDAVDVTVASIPTLMWGKLQNCDHLLELNEDYSLVIVDECHHSVAGGWKRLIKHLRKRMHGERILGISATPTRTAKGERGEFWRIFGGVIHEEKPLPLIRDRILASPNLVIVKTGLTFEMKADDLKLFERFHELPPRTLTEIGMDAERNRLVVKHLVDDLSKWGQTLLFSVDLAHARLLLAELKRKGVSAALLEGGSSPEERHGVLEAFRAKRLQVLVNVSLFTEGTDIPGVQSVFIARPSRSAILFQQMVGRGLRGPKLDGTETCNIVGFHDNITGLMGSQLSGDFSNESKALEVLGLVESPVAIKQGEQQDVTVHETAAETVQNRRWGRMLEEAKELLRKATLPAESETALGVPLLGWWETTAGGKRLFLPVFEGDVEAMGARIARALHFVDRNESLPEDGWAALKCGSEEYFRRIALAFRNRSEGPRYVALTLAPKTEIRALLEAVTEVASPQVVVGPTLIELARVRRASFGDKVTVRLDDVIKSVPRTCFDEANRIWEDNKGSVSVQADDSAIQMFANLLMRSASGSDDQRVVVRDLLAAAARSGALPLAEQAPDQPPRAADLMRELQAVGRDARGQALEDVRSAWFAEGSGWTEYLSEMVSLA